MLAPTVPFARHLFGAPTPAYKTGMVFLGWLTGHQDHLHDGRRACTRPAACRTCPRWSGWPTAAGALEDPELAAERWNGLPRPRTGSPRRWCRYERAPAAVAEPGDDQVRRPGHRPAGDRGGGHRRASGCGASRWPRSGWPPPQRLVADVRAAGVQPVPRRLLHRRRPRPCAGPRSRRTGARSPRPPPWPRPGAPGLGAGAGAGGRRAARRATGTCPAPGSGPRDAVGALVDDAVAAGVTLAIEPMHPIYAADRGVISTLGQALDVAEQFPAAAVGVVVDTFHVWWDPQLAEQIEPGRGRRPDRRATRSATGSPRCPPTPCSPAA